MLRSKMLLCLSLVLFPLAVAADATIPTRDIEGAADPNWLKRYEGSYIISHEQRGFDAVSFPASKLLKNEEGERDALNNVIFKAKDTRTVEGRYTRTVYLAPENRSPLEVLRNYLDLVDSGGGKVIYQCEDAACGGDLHGNNHGGGWQGLMEQIYPQNRLKDDAFSNGACATSSPPGEQRYALVTLPDDSGNDRTLGIYTFAIQTDTYCKAISGRTGILVVAVEPSARERKMVTVTSDEMANALATEGFIALYGLQFDTNKSTLRPESNETVTQIAKLMKEQPTLNADVVGHTDNVGDGESNKKLSERRANAVVAALVEDHGIDEARLVPRGEGLDKPVADNATEEGRAKNRRVELVKR